MNDQLICPIRLRKWAKASASRPMAIHPIAPEGSGEGLPGDHGGCDDAHCSTQGSRMKALSEVKAFADDKLAGGVK
jgi:hypothetical protein